MYSHLKLVAETKNTHYFDYQQNVTSFAHAHRCLFWSCPDVNIPMRISDIGEMIVAICATRIMGGPVTARVPIKVIIFLLLRVALGTNQNRAHGLTSCDIVDELVRNIAITLWCNILDISALNSSGPVLHQTSVSFFASDPMVNVGFDHEFVAQVLPQVEVHSVIVCLGDWGCSRHRDITSCRPVGTRRDGVRGIPKKPADKILFQMKFDQLPVAKKLLRALIIKETAKGAYYQHLSAPAHVCSCLRLCPSGNLSSVRSVCLSALIVHH